MNVPTALSFIGEHLLLSSFIYWKEYVLPIICKYSEKSFFSHIKQGWIYSKWFDCAMIDALSCASYKWPIQYAAIEWNSL